MSPTKTAWMTVAFLCAGRALAQHHHPDPPAPPPSPTPAARDRSSASPGAHAGHGRSDEPASPDENALHEGDDGRNLFQSDMSLMTGMTPRDPMPGMAGMTGWHLMDLGVARLVFNRQGGPSGASALESSNWNMIHAQRPVGPGLLSLMMMNSLEPATFEKLGSPELFQTGESYRGKPLVDRQHPHDFFMNLSATYRVRLGPEGGAWLQLAPVGEPALGPTAFMHRASSGDNPTAPLGHHWSDSTHIAFNVATLGAGWRWFAVEGSVFHGAEPDEHRWNIEGGRIDSASARAKFFFGGGWSAEASYGYLKAPEALEPGNTHRATAALLYGAEGDRPFAATLLWGRNSEAHGASEAYLAEAAWQVTPRDELYGRAEVVEKDFLLLAAKGSDEGPPGTARLARVAAVTLGYVREFDVVPGLRTGSGADVTGCVVPSGLKDVYGRSPVSLHVFLRLRWGRAHGGHAGHAGMKM